MPLTVNRVGSMLTAFFTDGPVTDYASAKRVGHRALRAASSTRCSSGGVFLAPSQFEAAFVSLAHGDDDLEEAARACRRAIAQARVGRGTSRGVR